MANRKPKEKDDIDRMLEGIDFHGMTADKSPGRTDFSNSFQGAVCGLDSQF